MLDSALHVIKEAVCIVCGKEVDDPDFQLCEDEPCIEQFKNLYLQMI